MINIIQSNATNFLNEGDNLLDFFAGSGSFGVSAKELGRKCTLVDNNPQAIDIIKKRINGSI